MCAFDRFASLTYANYFLSLFQFKCNIYVAEPHHFMSKSET